MNRIALTLAVLAAAGLAACERKPTIVAPTTPQECFYLADLPEGGVATNRVAAKVPSLEQCAAKLEIMRLEFLRLGGQNDEIVGAYQGSFLFLTHNGIYTSRKIGGPRFLLLVRYGDKLVMPGAVPQ